MRHSRFAALAASIGLGLFGIAPTQAAFVLTLDDLGTSSAIPDVTVVDEGSGDSFAGLGTLAYLGSAGNFTVNVTTGISKPEIGPARLSLNSVNITSGTSGGTLEIKLTDTDYSGSFPAYTADFGATTNGTVDFNFFQDSANVEFGEGTNVSNPAPGGPGTFSGTGIGSISPSSPFSLTIVAEVTHSGGQTTNLLAGLVPVPIPSVVYLFGSGLMGLVAVARRRKAA